MAAKDTPLIEIQCGTCGVWHAIPRAMHDTCVEEGGYWHCPNGHSRGYAEGRKEREAIRRERDSLKQDAARLNDELEAARRATAEAVKTAEEERKRAASIKKRASAGLCPCCNRSFQNVQRHMKSKHPNVVPLSQKGAI